MRVCVLGGAREHVPVNGGGKAIIGAAVMVCVQERLAMSCIVSGRAMIVVCKHKGMRLVVRVQ